MLWKVYHTFCSYNIYKGAIHTLLHMPNKNLQLPRSLIVHVWHFQWGRFEAQDLDNIYVSISRFFKTYWGFCARNIMTLILKTIIWDYSWGKVKPIYIYSRSGQWNCLSSWIQVNVLLKLHRYIHEQQNFEWKNEMCVSGQVKKT